MAGKKPIACQDENSTVQPGAIKSKKKSNPVDDDEYSIVTDLSEERLVSEEHVAKKKGKKGNVKNSLPKDEDEEENDGEEEDDDISKIQFAGNKKPKSNKKSVNLFSAAFDIEDEGDVSASESNNCLDEDFASPLTFSGKKKSSKKKNGIQSGLTDDKVDEVQPEPAEVSTSSKVAEPSKNKKKKKKAARAAEEEDDLDKILAELGEAPAPAAAAQPKAPAPAEPVEAEREAEAEEEGGVVESAAAKKKRKKKEKEKEKKLAPAAAVVEEKPEATKSKVAEKKVPKHVREMKEKIARQREAEERKKREEEEKLRKEEEERLRIEEEERIAEEKKRIKKEREKEKLQRKKLEGKFMTAKQKEEARRLEAMRNQILANAGGLPLDTSAPTKRLKYVTKKSKAQPQGNGFASAIVEATDSKEEDVEEAQIEVESVDVEEKSEVGDVVAENVVEVEDKDEEDDEEWDAKDWDDKDLKLPGISPFGDEESESEPDQLVKKESNIAKPVSTAAIPTEKVNHVPVKPQKIDTKKSQPSEPAEKSKQKNVAVKKEEPKLAENGGDLRSPICCIMGHVDTGKTKLLDCIRRTNVQEGGAGGITQQIGATYIPAEIIRDRTKELKSDAKLNVPGLLVIDTPGHESFANLRSRGSGLCNISVLVVDIMHGLEPQTIESLNLLKMRKTEFIIVLNKVDRLYGWKVCRNAPIVTALKQQTKDVMFEFNDRLSKIRTQFMEQGLNTELYYKNKEMGETFSIVPTSAISGEGIPDMLLLLVQWTQKTMTAELTYSSEIQCTVLEVKVLEGHGTTIDVVLVNGTLHEGDQIVVCGMNGPIVASIRALLTPHPMKELRVKGTYLHHKEINAAQCIKIMAQGLEHAVAGTALYVVGPDDELEDVKDLAMEDMKSVMSRIDKKAEGVCVQASTLGSLEALLEFLKTPAVNIPVSGINLGPVQKKDVMKASVMLEKKKEYATILAFDVKVTQEASTLAEGVGVRIFTADIIYHLFDQFKVYIDTLKEERKKETAAEAVFPCVLNIIREIYNKDPILVGVDIIEGIVKVGIPLCIPSKDFIDIGRIASIEINNKPVDYAKKGQQVAIMITGRNSEEQQKMFGRHFDMEDELVSHITRRSIDILKANYRDDLSIDEWKLVAILKKVLGIQ